MPLNHIDLQDQIKSFSHDTLRYQERIEEQTRLALQVLQRFATKIETMQELGRGAVTRIAIPTSENPAESFRSLSKTQPYNLVCADGSQIVPDPHTAPVFALVNVGIICIPADGAQSIQPIIISELYQHDKLYVGSQLISEDMLNLDRDVLEMRYLCEYCQGLNGPIIALRDGLLELYHEPRIDKAFRERFLTYHTYLQSLKSAHIIAAGYVDKPRSQSLVELLRRCASDESSCQSLKSFFPDIIERQLLEQKLGKGNRSAIFEKYLPPNEVNSFPKITNFFFFYLNVSQSEKPWIVRVEIPEWVALDPSKVDLLHTALLEQCAIMGNKPYPYCLHRAHETALVRQAEKIELEKRINAAQLWDGIPLDEKSYKQSAKDHLPRKTVERKR
jgi:hypothetical protein